MIRIIVFSVMFVPYLVLAEVAPSEGIAFLDSVLNFVSGLSGAALVLIAGAVDMVMRLFNSEKPKSIAWTIAVVLSQVGKLATKFAEILDKVLPQRVKEVQTLEKKP